MKTHAGFGPGLLVFEGVTDTLAESSYPKNVLGRKASRGGLALKANLRENTSWHSKVFSDSEKVGFLQN